MRRMHLLIGGSLLGCLVVLLGLSGRAQSPFVRKELTFTQRLAAGAKLSEENADKFLQALGPAIRDELKGGKEVSIPGLGRFRVVRVEEHRDLREGRPVTVPASNRVEFIASGGLDDAANSPSAKAADDVVPFRYIPLPTQTPGQKAPNSRTPPTRVK